MNKPVNSTDLAWLSEKLAKKSDEYYDNYQDGVDMSYSIWNAKEHWILGAQAVIEWLDTGSIEFP